MTNLFSYGTLQLPAVQLEVFGRLVEQHSDELAGFKKELTKIKIESVVEISGKQQHPIISYTGKIDDIITGVVLEVTPEELSRADKYETEDYKRIEVRLQSGKQSWVYVANDESIFKAWVT